MAIPELKKIDFTQSSFVANGVTYYVKESLSIERYKWFEKYQLVFGFARDFKGIYDTLEKSIGLANKGKGVEAWNIIYNIKEEVGKNLDNKAHTAYYICALFIVTEDEDLTQWNEQTAETKIANWNAEGYDVNSFFQLAANLVPNYLDVVENIFQNTSELAATLETLKQMQPSSSNTSS